MAVALSYLTVKVMALILFVYLAAFAGHYLSYLRESLPGVLKNLLSGINALLLAGALLVVCKALSDSNLALLYPGFLVLVFACVNRYSGT